MGAVWSGIMRRTTPGLLPGLLLVVAACRAAPPGRFETAVVDGLKRHLTIGGKSDTNPLPATDDTFGKGLDLFTRHCQSCHGLDGQNTGVPFADSMSPPVPSLADHEVQAYTDGQLRWIIENGVSPSGMPAWKGILDADEMWAIVHYMRHLPPKGSLGEPTFYEGIQRIATAPASSDTPSAWRSIMGSIGIGELSVMLFIALLLFGGKKLPEMGRGLGAGIRDFRRALSGDENGGGEEGRRR
jgi:TatA/E family protein of Tat protein translocase